jgi:hypothetical protein
MQTHTPDAMQLSSPFGPAFPADHAQIPPQFRWQFLYTPETPERVVLKGELTRIWFRPRWLKPALWFFSKLNILVDQTGEHIPATFELGAYRNSDGYPVQTWKRTFHFPTLRHFNARMVYEPAIGRVADLLGPFNCIHSFFIARFQPPSMFTLDTSHFALGFGKYRLWLPRWLWRLMFGVAHFEQVAVPDSDTVKIDLRIHHPLFGEMFGYIGTFSVIIS